jgi:hypothetical protein
MIAISREEPQYQMNDSRDPRSHDNEPYHGMTWSVRLLVYGVGGIVLMLVVALAMRRHWEGKWWILLIPIVTAIVGTIFPRAVDAFFAWLSRIVLAILRR